MFVMDHVIRFMQHFEGITLLPKQCWPVRSAVYMITTTTMYRLSLVSNQYALRLRIL